MAEAVLDEKEQRCDFELNRLKERLRPEDYAVVERFHRELKAGQRKASTRFLYLYALDVLTGRVKKSLKAIEKEDLVNFFADLEGKREESSIINFKVKLKRFFQYIHGMEERNYPACVKWIKGKRYQTKLKKSDLLTPKELERMIDACLTQKDRAFISGLFESKCRPGEFLALLVGHVQVNGYGVALNIDTEKVGGTREVPLVRSAPEMVLWLRMHPFREDPTAPLWCVTTPRPIKKPISYRRALQIVKGNAKRAGVKKRVWSYLLRHTSITAVCTKIKEPVLRRLVGWSRDSKMPSVYEHLAGLDVETAVLEAEGVEVKPAPEYLGMPRECPRCNFKTTPKDRFCPNCGLPLDVETAMKYEERREKADELMSRLFDDEEFRRFVDRKMRELSLKEPEEDQ